MKKGQAESQNRVDDSPKVEGGGELVREVSKKISNVVRSKIQKLLRSRIDDGISWKKIVESLEAKEDFVELFRQLEIPGELWRSSAWLQKNGFGTLRNEIIFNERFGSWINFLSFVGPPSEMKIDETILQKNCSQQVAACKNPDDFRALFRLHGIQKEDDWRSAGWLARNGYQALYVAIKKDPRFGLWTVFLEFMGPLAERQINDQLLLLSCPKQVAACKTPDEFRALFALHGVSEEVWTIGKSLVKIPILSSFYGVIQKDERFGSKQSFLRFMGISTEDLDVDAELLQHSQPIQIASCKTPEDFLKLFLLIGMPDGEWKSSSWLQENGFAGYYSAIKKDKRFGSWEAFLEFMDSHEVEQEFEKLSKLGLEEAAAFFRDDPWKFKEYIQFAHPELSEDEVDRLTMRSFRGMRMGSLEKNEEKYLKWDMELSSMNLAEEPPEVTTEPTIVLSGTAASNVTHIFIAGACTRTKRVDESGKFALTIPLKIGQTNDLRIMSIDKNGKKRSEQGFFAVKQKGKPDDVAALVELLSKLKDLTISEVQQNPGRFQHLCRCMEQSLIKRFGRSFSDGEKYVAELIERETTTPAMRKVLRSVLAKFKKIHQAEIPGTVPGSLLFFQKYCAVDIRRRIEEGLPGVFLANAPGTGKTRIVQAATADMDTTVITPNSVVSAWDEESGKVLEDADVLALRGVSHAVRKEQLRTRKRLRATLDTPHHTYINREFLQRVDDLERFKLLSDEETVVVHDEGHSRANEQSLQSKGASMLDSQFQILVSATPFKNPRTFRRMMAILRPKDKRFSNDAAFSKAFPADNPQALRTLSLLKQDVTLRFREEDVFETVDPKQSLSQQRHKLPSKEFIDPEKIGSFEMSNDQAESIYQMFVNWNRWCKTNSKYIPKDRTATEDHLRVGDGFAKRHALRQTVNNPSYINSKAPDHKLNEAKKIVQQCMKEGRKVVIFCAYEAQAQKYVEVFADLQPALYTGETSALGDSKDVNSKPIKYKKGESEDDHHAWVLDSSGRPIPDPNGETMSALDYERITFQNITDRKLLIATYSAGSVGSTFTAGNAMILDDLPADCVEAIQAEGRIRRIDPNRLTHATKKYYALQSQYPASFMEKVSKRWLVKQEHFYKEFDSREAASKYAEKRGLKYMNAAEEFFEQGTYDEVHGRNLKVQRVMFNLINDGIADDSILGEDQEMFKGLSNGKNVK